MQQPVDVGRRVVERRVAPDAAHEASAIDALGPQLLLDLRGAVGADEHDPRPLVRCGRCPEIGAEIGELVDQVRREVADPVHRPPGPDHLTEPEGRDRANDTDEVGEAALESHRVFVESTVVHVPIGDVGGGEPSGGRWGRPEVSVRDVEVAHARRTHEPLRRRASKEIDRRDGNVDLDHPGGLGDIDDHGNTGVRCECRDRGQIVTEAAADGDRRKTEQSGVRVERGANVGDGDPAVALGCEPDIVDGELADEPWIGVRHERQLFQDDVLPRHRSEQLAGEVQRAGGRLGDHDVRALAPEQGREPLAQFHERVHAVRVCGLAAFSPCPEIARHRVQHGQRLRMNAPVVQIGPVLDDREQSSDLADVGVGCHRSSFSPAE